MNELEKIPTNGNMVYFMCSVVICRKEALTPYVEATEGEGHR